MNKIGDIIYKEIKRISPSQFYSMKNCAYKSLLAEAFERKPLLPVSPNAYFGTVLHKMLELIAKRVVQTGNDFERLFDEQVKVVEESLLQQGYSFFVPLQKNVKDYGMKKIILKKHLRTISDQPTNPTGIKFHSEKWFESKDKLIAGKIDLVIEAREEIEIIDFKTGEVTEDFLDDAGELFSEVKEGYKNQLRLYAYLYYESTGNFPTRLSLIDLTKQKFKIEFSKLECSAVFGDAKNLLHSTNESISRKIFAANPSEENCKYCLYRPACSFFSKQIKTDYSFNDISGSVKNVAKYHNGNVSVFLESEGRLLTVTSFPSEKYDQLNDSRNKQISIYNLRKEATEFAYSAIKTTMIYG